MLKCDIGDILINEEEQETVTENGQEITREVEIEILFIDEIGNRGDIYK